MEKAEKLLGIFEAYNLCDAREIGQLVRQEMLVAIGKQEEINWDCIGLTKDQLKHAKERYQAVHEMINEPQYKDHYYRLSFEK